VFLLTGTTKLVLPREVLEKRMHWAPSWPRWRIKMLGLAEVAGALGLVVPAATGVAPILSPIAALCFAVLMLGAAARTAAWARASSRRCWSARSAWSSVQPASSLPQPSPRSHRQGRRRGPHRPHAAPVTAPAPLGRGSDRVKRLR
jgi:hypothetical protein